MPRVVEPELLDTLPSMDPQAKASRTDLRRLNFLMGNAGILTRALRHHLQTNPFRPISLSLLELGAGDGTLMLRLAHQWSQLGVTAEVTLIDRHDIVSAATRRSFARLRWPVKSVGSDLFEWLNRPAPIVDVIVVNLLLHHFKSDLLAKLFRLVSPRTNLFIACEPHRSSFALAAARSLALLGCNEVTRHDAVVSVRAGFVANELSLLWPKNAEWELSETSAGLFSHCFTAKRNV